MKSPVPSMKRHQRLFSSAAAVGFAVALLLAAAVPAAAQSVQPTVPFAINKDGTTPH